MEFHTCIFPPINQRSIGNDSALKVGCCTKFKDFDTQDLFILLYLMLISFPEFTQV